jgi:HlyD family secretion protein
MRKILTLIALAVAVAVAFGYGRVTQLVEAEPQDELPTLRIARTTLSEAVVALGTVESEVGAEVKVGSRLSGVLEDLRVNIGDRVRKGQVLARLEDSELSARVDILESEMGASIADLEFARGELERAERLSDLLPASEIDEKHRNLRVLEERVKSAEARLAEARIQLGYSIIRAPVSGTIASVSTYEGETVAASLSAPTFVTIVDLDRLEVHAYVDEVDIGRVFPGQAVTFRVDAFPGRELDGVVRAVYPKAELVNNVVNYVVIVDILDRGDLLIRPEMTAHVNFVLAERENVVAVPRTAVMRRRGEDLVVVREGERWVERPVETGLQTPQRIEIVSGLSVGETIVADKQAWLDREEGR